MHQAAAAIDRDHRMRTFPIQPLLRCYGQKCGLCLNGSCQSCRETAYTLLVRESLAAKRALEQSLQVKMRSWFLKTWRQPLLRSDRCGLLGRDSRIPIDQPAGKPTHWCLPARLRLRQISDSHSCGTHSGDSHISSNCFLSRGGMCRLCHASAAYCLQITSRRGRAACGE